MKERLRDEKKIVVTTLILCGVFLFLYHLLVTESGLGDDYWYKEVTATYSLPGYVLWRFEEWTSRWLIEGVLYCLAYLPFVVWQLLDSLVILLGIYALACILGRKCTPYFCIIVILVLGLIPIENLSSAGWMATCVNYVWPCMLGLFCFVPIADRFRGEQTKEPIWLLCLRGLAGLFAASQEQVAALLFGFLVVYAVFAFVKGKKLFLYGIVLKGIVVFQLVVALLGPGNANRNAQEIAAWFPEFAGASLIEKLSMGFISTTAYYIGGVGKQLLLIAFFGILLFALKTSEKGRKWFLPFFLVWICLLIAGYPLRSSGMEISFGGYTPYYELLTNIYTQPHGLCGYEVFWIAVEGIIGLLVLLVWCFGIYLVCGKTRRCGMNILLLMAGVLSRLIMGFSPTIYASGFRTAIFCTIICLLVCLDLIKDIKGKRNRGLLLLFLVCTVLLQIVCAQ